MRILTTVLCFALAGVLMMLGDMRTVSFDEALSVTKSEFTDYSAEYYKVNNGDMLKWTIFVDMHPRAMWCHDCCLVTVSKTIEEGEDIEVKKAFRNSPSGLTMEKLVMPNSSYPLKDKITQYPLVPRVDPIPNSLSTKSYAIILNGGMD